MSRTRVAVIAMLSLAVLSLSVWLYMQGRRPGLPSPALEAVRPCTWDPKRYPPAENTCQRRCGASYGPEEMPSSAPIDGTPHAVCCPKGYWAHTVNGVLVCSKVKP